MELLCAGVEDPGGQGHPRPVLCESRGGPPSRRVVGVALWTKSSTPPRDTAWAMSQENVELLHQGVAAWNRRDLDGYLELADPEIEWYSGATRVEGGVYRGREGMRRFWTDVYVVYDELVT